jgi:uncharacterized repeat protein (TIGR01451 family)
MIDTNRIYSENCREEYLTFWQRSFIPSNIMKIFNMKTKRLAAFCLLSVLLSSAQRAEAAPACCITFPAAPGNHADAHVTIYYPTYLTADSWFTTTLSNNVGPVPAGRYATWCVDSHTDINPAQSKLPGTPFSGAFYSTCNPADMAQLPIRPNANPPVGPPPIVTMETWNKINYILNHRAGYFYWDVQAAINSFVGGPALTSDPAYAAIPYHPAAVQALTNAANANAASWSPQCGDKVGVIFVIDWTVPLQLLILEVPCVCLTCPSGCGHVGQPYSSALVGDAKTPPFTYSIVSGSLPDGLALNSDGTIVGTPTTAGTFPFEAKFVDSSIPPQSKTVACGITIYDAITLVCAASGGQVGVPYSSVLVASGGSGPYTYSVSSGLPDGLSLDPSTGVISGNPTAIGPFTFTVHVEDSSGCGAADQVCSIEIKTLGAIGDYVWIDTNGNGKQDEPATNGVNGVTVNLYTCDDTNTVLATTVTADNAGNPGYYLFTNLVAGCYVVGFEKPTGTVLTGQNVGTDTGDSDAEVVSGMTENIPLGPGQVDLTVDAGLIPELMLICQSQTVGQVNVPYTSALVANGGVPGYTFSITSGVLPGGLTLDPSTGLISGTPTVAGVFPFTASVVDLVGGTAQQTATQVCSIEIKTLGAIGDYVWIDTNGNGKQDEPATNGVNGVTVNLYTCDDTNTVLATTVTADNAGNPGYYLFTNLVAGCYVVGFEKPTGTVLTVQNSVTDSEDSDADVDSGKTGIIPLAAGEVDLTVDAGLIPVLELTVVAKTDALCKGANNGTITITATGGVSPLSYSIDGGGSFVAGNVFTGLAPGAYNVVVKDALGSTASYTSNPVLVSEPVISAYVSVMGNDASCSGNDGSVTATFGGGTAPYRISFNLGALAPASSPQIFTGLSAGDYEVTIVDANDCSDTKTVSIKRYCPLGLICPANGAGQVGVPYTSALVATGGTAPYTFSITLGNLPPGLTLNPATGEIVGTPTTAGTYGFTAQVVDSTAGTAQTTAIACNIVVAPPECVASTFIFSGNSSGSGTAGNIRTFTTNGISVKVSAFSRNKSTGAWAPAYLGLFSGGFGVTDTSEDGYSNSHTVDNIGQDNYVLFEFSQPVAVNRAFVGYVVGDSDLTAWVGSATDPFNNHLALSDSLLSGLALREDNLTTSGEPRWAEINGGGINGNVLIIAAQPGDTTPDDEFKINLLGICEPKQTLALACVSANAGQVGVNYSSALQASGGTAPYTYSILSGSLPLGLTLNPVSGLIYGIPTAAGSYNFTAKVVDSSAGTAQTKSVTCSVTITAPECVNSTFIFSGNTAGSGTAGNIRTFTTNGVSVKVSAFSRNKSTGAWAPAFLGLFSGGFGVTDTSEDGSGNTHTVDNIGRDNFVLFEFSQPVVVNRAFLGYVVNDSDLTAWVGTATDPFNNHQSLSDAWFASLALREENETTSANSRWSDLNGGGLQGNVFVVAASVVDSTPDDEFKINLLEICQPKVSLALACAQTTVGQVGTAFSSALQASGGTAPYAFSITSGSLPAGLNLNPASGLISGVPTTAGTFNFTAKVVDSTGGTALSVTKTCAILINPAPCSGLISGAVIRDCANDGSLTSDPGLAGVTVTLKKGTATIGSVVTDNAGAYSFGGLPAGTYVIVITPPANMKQTVDPDYCADNQKTLTITTCQTVTNVKFGYTGTAPSVFLKLTGPASAKCGDTITFTFAVTNTGNTCVYGGLQVISPLLGGEVFHRTPVFPGEGFVFTKDYVVRTSASGTLVHTAWAVGHPPIGKAVTNTAASSTIITAPPAAPGGLCGTPVNMGSCLSWNTVSGCSYKLKRSFSPGGPYTVIKSGLTSVSCNDTPLTNGKPCYYVVSAVKGGVEGPDSAECSVVPTTVPSPWTAKDVGTVGELGGAGFVSASGLFTVSGSGNDIWDAADEMQYVYQPASGNCSITARVTGLSATDPWAKAGVMIRESLTTSSKHVSTFVTPANGVAFQYRSTTGGSSGNINDTGLAAPYWVRVVRSGSTFTAYRSANGTSWTTIGSVSVSMGTSVYIGLGVTSHNDGALCTATIDNVTAVP